MGLLAIDGEDFGIDNLSNKNHDDYLIIVTACLSTIQHVLCLIDRPIAAEHASR
jgi:hypothetical protein